MRTALSAALLPALFILAAPFARAQVDPLINVDWPNFTWPYNALYPEDPEGPGGHEGNSCGPSSMARIIKYWEWPVQGDSSVAYTDYSGNWWEAVYDTARYRYERMPYSLSSDAPESEYWETARLFHDACASTMGQHGFSDGRQYILDGFTTFLKYRDDYRIANDWEMTAEAYRDSLMANLNAGRPILVEGRTPDSPPPWEPGGWQGHWWVIDGYRVEPDTAFHIVFGFGDYDDYYPADGMPIYSAYNSAVLGLEPDRPAASLEVTVPDAGYFIAGSDTTIEWTASGVDSVRVLVSDNNGWDYTVLAEGLPAATGSHPYTVPATPAEGFRVKVEAMDDPNVRDRAPFAVVESASLLLLHPTACELAVGVETAVSWSVTGLTGTVDVEFSSDGGSSYSLLAGGVPLDEGHVFWTVPDSPSDSCRVRLSTSSGTQSLSDPFSIISNAPVGGPYPVDENTVLLLGFNHELRDLTGTHPFVNDVGSVELLPSALPGHDQAVRIYNGEGLGSSCLRLLDADDLDLTGDWTIEAWFRINSIGEGVTSFPHLVIKPGDGNTMDANYGVMLLEEYGARGYYAAGNGTAPEVVSGSALPLDQWIHVAWVRDTWRGEQRIFLHDAERNLLSQATAPAPSTPVPSSQYLYIGGVHSASNIQFDGWLDELRISDVARNITGEHAADEPPQGAPRRFALLPPYPNPFNRAATVSFTLDRARTVHLTVHDLLGRHVADLASGRLAAGGHRVQFAPHGLASGTYFLRLEAEGEQRTVRLLLLK